MLQGVYQIKNKISLIFQHIHCLNSINSVLAWILYLWELKSAKTILNPDYFSDFVSLSYNYGQGYRKMAADTSNSSLDYCDRLVGNYNDTYHHSVVKSLTDTD